MSKSRDFTYFLVALVNDRLVDGMIRAASLAEAKDKFMDMNGIGNGMAKDWRHKVLDGWEKE